jgi:hypothetical protein
MAATNIRRDWKLKLSIHLWLYTPLLVFGRFFGSVILCTVVRTPWTGDQYKHIINADRHPCVKWDSNPRSQVSTGLRKFMP